MIDIKKKKSDPEIGRMPLKKGIGKGIGVEKLMVALQSSIVRNQRLLVTGYRLPATDEPRSLRVVMAARGVFCPPGPPRSQDSCSTAVLFDKR